MPLTPITGSAPYCSPAQFLKRYDVRTVGDLLSDNNVRLTPSQVTTALTFNPITNPDTVLAEASGWLESMIIKGQRYQIQDLLNLAATPGNGAAFLARLVADGTMYLLYDRRPDRRANMPERVKAAHETYVALSRGEQILPFLETQEAGVHTERIRQPLEQANLVTDRGYRYFGVLDETVGIKRG